MSSDGRAINLKVDMNNELLGACEHCGDDIDPVDFSCSCCVCAQCGNYPYVCEYGDGCGEYDPHGMGRPAED